MDGALKQALSTPEFQQQCGRWRKQREQLRINFREIWSAQAANFKQWWLTATPEVRLAVVLTARQDIGSDESQNSSPSASTLDMIMSLAMVMCPELDPEYLLEEREEGQAPEVIGALMDQVSEQRVVETELFSRAALVESLGEGFDVEPLLVLRSIILLQFCTALAIVYGSAP
eukprot:m51a1_g6357 hypothetical protein (173) ;mRNA; r:96828-97437